MPRTAKRAFYMRPIYDTLLWGTLQMRFGLFPLYLATADQLCRLHYQPGCIKAVKARLKVLVDQGYVYADTIPHREFKTPYFYGLTPKGMRYLQSIKVTTQDAGRPGGGAGTHALFVQHTLEANDVVISAVHIGRADPHYQLRTFRDERTLRRRPFPATWRDQRGRQQKFQVIPDAYIEFARDNFEGSTAWTPVLLEHDRGTEMQAFFRRRIRAYVAFFEQDGPMKLFKSPAARVVFTTFEGKGRVAQMQSWTRTELEECGHTEYGKLFCFAALEQPVNPRCWLSPIWSTAENMQPVMLLAA